MVTKKDLIQFEKDVITEYKKGNTYGPVHLSGGNEEQLIEIFKEIKKQDWVFTTWRSHYHAFLKSNDRNWLMNEIIVKANSSHINSKKYKIFSSAIVGGIIPIALGTALAIKLRKGKEKVFCFVGDMASHMGQFHEAVKYATGYGLPIMFIIEDNDIGCNSPTELVWEYPTGKRYDYQNFTNVVHYTYTRTYPHYGIGEWITFNDKKTKGVGDYNASK